MIPVCPHGCHPFMAIVYSIVPPNGKIWHCIQFYSSCRTKDQIYRFSQLLRKKSQNTVCNSQTYSSFFTTVYACPVAFILRLSAFLMICITLRWREEKVLGQRERWTQTDRGRTEPLCCPADSTAKTCRVVSYRKISVFIVKAKYQIKECD